MVESKRTVFDERGNKLELNEIMSFRVQELQKDFIAHTIVNEDGEIDIHLVEVIGIDTLTPSIKKIDDAIADMVIEMFYKVLDSND